MNPLARERRSRDTRPQPAWRHPATPCKAAQFPPPPRTALHEYAMRFCTELNEQSEGFCVFGIVHVFRIHMSRNPPMGPKRLAVRWKGEKSRQSVLDDAFGSRDASFKQSNGIKPDCADLVAQSGQIVEIGVFRLTHVGVADE